MTAGGEERFHSILDAALDAVVSIDASGVITGWNPTAEKSFGWTAAEAVGLRLTGTIIPERLREAHERGLSHYLETGEGPVIGRRIEVVARRRSGEEFPVELTITPLRGEGGLAFIAFIRDLSEHKRSEQALRAQKDLFANLVAVARATAERPTLEETLQKAFDVLKDITGAQGGTLLLVDAEGRVSVRLLGGRAAVPMAPEQTALVMEKGLAGWVVRERAPALVSDAKSDERFITLPIQRFAVGSAVGVPVLRGPRLVGVLTLVHRTKGHFQPEHLEFLSAAADQLGLAVLNAQYVETLRDEDERFQAVIRSSRDGILLVGADDHLLVVNDTALRLLQRPETVEAWTRRPLGELLALLPRAAQRAISEAAANSAAPGSASRVAGFENGRFSLRCLSHNVTSRGKSVGRLVVLRDVTEDKRLERMREDLTRTMVHDLRGPLTVMKASLDVMRTVPESQDGMRERAEQAANEMTRLVDGILDISRLEQGSFPVDRQAVDLPALVADLVDRAAPVAGRKRQQVSSDLVPGTPVAWVDRGLMERVIQNLLQNAMKFTPAAGSIKVSVRSDRPGWLRVAVEDSGPGIPSDLRRRLFEKFAAGAVDGAGSGLGLAFCRLAVEAHGGRIWLEDGGLGARFHLALPAFPQDDAEA